MFFRRSEPQFTAQRADPRDHSGQGVRGDQAVRRPATNDEHEDPVAVHSGVTVSPHDLVGPYAVGALDLMEVVRFEHHLEECSRCRTELRTLRAAAARLVDPEH
nr:zf-HC2 domain-containing protein [Aeromicrobium stalagmiti]